MKKSLIKISMLCVCAGLTFTACKKKTDDTTPADTSQQTNGGDDTRAQNESDAAANDAEAAISATGSTMRTSASFLLYYAGGVFAGASVDTTNGVSNKSLVITYDNSTVVGGRIRSGKITISLAGNHWSTEGAVLTLVFDNYKATRTSDGKSITLNGTKKIINTSGGDASSLSPGSGTITRKITATNMQITFDDNTTRTWSTNRIRTITRQSTGYTVSTVGDTSITVGNTTYGPGVAAWGTTRLNSPFYSIINDPIVWNNADCLYTPVSGSRTIQGIVTSLTITYGVNANGDVVAPAAGTCAYGIKLNWGTSNQAIISY